MSIIPNYVPRQYKTVNVILKVRGAQSALDFYNRAFGAEEVLCLRDAEGLVVHAEFKIADTIIMVTEGEVRGPGVTVQIFTPDVEGILEDAVRAGAKVLEPISPNFLGDRSVRIKDPFGHEWVLATHMEDLTAQELEKRWSETFL